MFELFWTVRLRVWILSQDNIARRVTALFRGLVRYLRNCFAWFSLKAPGILWHLGVTCASAFVT